MAASLSLKKKIGAIIYDLPRFMWAMRPSWLFSHGIAPWLYVRNRNEQLATNNEKTGIFCDWQWTSDLYLTNVFNFTARLLMKKALQDWPIVKQHEPAKQRRNVEVSFIIGHRNKSRLPHLLATLQTIAAQKYVRFECLVVEQSPSPEIEKFVPSWVRYIHTPLPRSEMPYCRAWAFNVGARLAQGKLLILHDNDILVPQRYAAEHTKYFSMGYKVINLKRYIFYPKRMDTERFFQTGNLSALQFSEKVKQNARGGGSIAITKDAYFAIGGFDEDFVGWGGEDNEFWERAQTLNVYNYGFLPIVHLWHPPQPGKTPAKNTPGMRRFSQLTMIPIENRIKNLRNRNYLN